MKYYKAQPYNMEHTLCVCVMRNEEIRKILCEQQEENDRINKAEEEEEEYEKIVIPKTQNKKHK